MSLDRASLRQQRAALSASERQRAADLVATRVPSLLAGMRSLAAYVAVDGELDPAPVVRWAWRESITVYLPRIHNVRGLTFAAHRPKIPLEAGLYGIPAPPGDAPQRAAKQLDAVLVPVVAFDRAANRAGMGAGYYDRAFAFRLSAPRPARPLLIGLAYAWQEVDAVERRPWDVPLDVVVTDREIIRPDKPPARR